MQVEALYRNKFDTGNWSDESINDSTNTAAWMNSQQPAYNNSPHHNSNHQHTTTNEAINQTGEAILDMNNLGILSPATSPKPAGQQQPAAMHARTACGSSHNITHQLTTMVTAIITISSVRESGTADQDVFSTQLATCMVATLNHSEN